MEVDPYDQGLVPHLHRTDPEHQWLASWDDLRKQLQLRDVGLTQTKRLRVTGLKGNVTHMRWLRDSSGVVFVTSANAFVARLNPGAELDGGTLWAHPVFGKRTTKKFSEISELRVINDGLVALTYAGGTRDVWFVPVTASRVGAPKRFTPKSGRVGAMSVRSGSRVVLSMHTLTGDLPQLWTMRVNANGRARVLSRRDCASDECEISNWSPRTRRLVYALSDGSVVIAGRGDREDTVIELGDYELRTHTLWLNERENRLLLANNEEVTLYDMDGEVVWSWSPKNGDPIHSARFDLDGKSVLATAGRRAVRVKGGKAKLLFKTRMKAPTFSDDNPMHISSEVFVDDITPLKNGALAYHVVAAKVEERWDDDEYEYDEEEWDEDEAEEAE